MRAELLTVIQRIRYVIKQWPLKERERARLTAWNITVMFSAAALVLILYFLSLSATKATPNAMLYWPSPSLFLVLFAGLVGGFVSVQQRLQEPSEVDPFLKFLDLGMSGYSLLISSAIGMCFAVVLFGAMIGGLLTGGLFPSFSHDSPAADCSNVGAAVEKLVCASLPSQGSDWGKLAVWAFAAGFLERLVPDILTRIAFTAEPKK